MRIGMIQMAAAEGDVEKNKRRAFSLLEEAAPHSDLIVMPELWTVGYNFHDFSSHVISMNDEIIRDLSFFAQTHRVVLEAGTLPIKEQGKVKNMSLIFDADGEIQASYSKRHLFQGYLEGRLMTAGKKLMKTHLHGVQVGIAVCYECYFPRMWRKMANQGTTLVIVPASWPMEHIMQWRILTRARAIENGICVCAVNMAGTYHGIKLGGHSLFIDPLGNILAEGGEGEEVIYAFYDEEKYKDLGCSLSLASCQTYGDA